MIFDHVATLRGTRGRFLWREIITQFVLPVAAGSLTFLAGFRVGIVGELIAGFSVLAGFLFGLVIFVFQLRLGMTVDPRVQSKAQLPELIDQLFSNVLYAVLVSFALITVTIVAAATEPHTETLATVVPGGAQVASNAPLALGLDPWVSGLIAALALHLLAVVTMCLRRTRAAYSELRN